MPELHAICWQDTSEPWGWAPAVEDVPEGALPDGPFFWDREEANVALVDLLERAASEAVVWIRDQDRHRHALQAARNEDLMKGKIPGVTTPGVSVVFADDPPGAAIERIKARVVEPEPLMTEEELLVAARESAACDWSIQTYEVPDCG